MKETMLDRYMNQLRQQAYIDNQANGQSLMQLCFDTSLIVLHDTFGFGRERCMRFHDAYTKQLDEIADFIMKDDDPDALYAKEKIDQKLRMILGDEVIPWNERYTATINPARNREQRRAEKKRKKGRR